MGIFLEFKGKEGLGEGGVLFMEGGGVGRE